MTDKGLRDVTDRWWPSSAEQQQIDAGLDLARVKRVQHEVVTAVVIAAVALSPVAAWWVFGS
jgi:hypothetical protein